MPAGAWGLVMHTGWYRMDVAALPRGVVVAVATDEAAPLWRGPIASVLEELADKLPAESRPDVAFLGDRKTHPLAAVLRGLAETPPTTPGLTIDIATQLGRYPVAGPLFRELLLGPARPVVLITTVPLLDLVDWIDPETTGRTLVYRLAGADRVSPAEFTEIGPEADLGVLVEHLRDPVKAVRISHPASLAIDWDNPAYRWDAGALVCDEPGDLGVTALFAQIEPTPPEAAVTRGSGAEIRVPLVPGRPVPPLAAVPLTAAEANVMSLWRRGTSFWCSGCSQSHPPGQVRCAAAADGPGLFPTLRTTPRAPLYRAEAKGAAWLIRPIPRGIVLLPDETVLAGPDGAVSLYAAGPDQWEPRHDTPSDFLPLGDGGFILPG